MWLPSAGLAVAETRFIFAQWHRVLDVYIYSFYSASGKLVISVGGLDS